MTIKKQDPEKYCETCGARLARKRWPNGRLQDFGTFLRTRFCGILCIAWENDRHKERTAHGHEKLARKLKPPGPCEECGAEGKHVHHIDGNGANNAPGNLQRLCPQCHHDAHTLP